MSLTAFVFARGGSKGLPGKNIKPLVGNPLIGWAIEQALSVNDISRVIVSTDDSDIADVARDYGAYVPFMRPEYLASDTASEWDAWRHALEYLKEEEGFFPDPFISIPGTSPLRRTEDIEACLKEYRKGDADVVVAVTGPHRNPWFNMVRKFEDGSVGLVNKLNGTVTRRQDAPEIFDMTTFAYIANPEHIIKNRGVFSGVVRAIEVPIECSIDIDTPYDFEIAEYLMKKRIGLT